MKTTLLFFFAIFGIAASAQVPVNNYYGIVTPEPIDGVSQRTYIILSSPVPLEQSASGPNVIWDFTGFTEAGTAIYTNTEPSPEEIAEFPTSNMDVSELATDGSTVTSSTLYMKILAGATSVTGAVTTDLMLNFATNNAYIGQFPMTYGTTNTDPVAGNYVFGTYSGTFTGTVTTTADAYGTMSTDYAAPVDVTRIKTVQTLTLAYLTFPSAGTVTQTIYYYYRAGDNYPYFKSMTTTVNVPLLGLNETQRVLQHANPTILSTVDNSWQDSIALAPNPVSNVLSVSGNVDIMEVEFADVNGRVVMKNNNASLIDMTPLSAGVYFLRIRTSEGTALRKVIKE